MANLKARFRDGLHEFCKKHYEIEFEKLSTVQIGEGLILFYVKEILSKSTPGVFPEDEEEILECITDGQNDQSCDFIFSADDHHYIIQGKYHKKNKTEEEGEVHKFISVLERLHHEYGKKYKKNRKVTDAVNAFDFKRHTFTLLYITLGKASNDIRNLEKTGIKNVSDCKDLSDISNRADFDFIDETNLNKEYRDILSGIDLNDVDLKITKDESGKFLVSTYKFFGAKIFYYINCSESNL